VDEDDYHFFLPPQLLLSEEEIDKQSEIISTLHSNVRVSVRTIQEVTLLFIGGPLTIDDIAVLGLIGWNLHVSYNQDCRIEYRDGKWSRMKF
jgi:hypothetical protein